ncbi:MAG: hypothetical protein ACMXYL_05825, partial [Candidatus Woesearchaeota archaeon]
QIPISNRDLAYQQSSNQLHISKHCPIKKATKIGEGTIAQILELYDLCYGEKASYSPFIRMLAKERNPAPWKWKNQTPVYGLEANIALAYEDDVLAGYTSYLYKMGKSGEEKRIIAQSNDAMVHPGHQ